ncbi:hypothetical protein, partial [Akkermansia sp.]|uniref:hypothetical protein n=2 Tax=Akkermansia sp. TaxID=1872421 RepID=UPI003AAB2074
MAGKTVFPPASSTVQAASDRAPNELEARSFSSHIHCEMGESSMKNATPSYHHKYSGFGIRLIKNIF